MNPGSIFIHLERLIMRIEPVFSKGRGENTPYYCIELKTGNLFCTNIDWTPETDNRNSLLNNFKMLKLT